MATNLLVAPNSSTVTWQSADLHFIPPDRYPDAIESLYLQGARTFLMRPYDPSFAVQLKLRLGSGVRILTKARNSTEFDAIIVPPMSGESLVRELEQYIDKPVRLLAPITDNYIANRSLFTVTIPKAGTHLLFHLLDSFGLRAGGEHCERLEPNTYYFAFREHSHLPADQLVEFLAHTPRGGAGHPILSAPVLFIYRNPLDILVSEVFYYVNRENTAVAPFYEDLSPSERALDLIQGYPLIPSLRERVGRYAPWLRLKNAVPLCYEELIGQLGDGSDEAQARAVWSLQLKLQVPGSPVVHARRAYTEKSHTFRKGRINDHREMLTEEHYAAIRRLPQDFLQDFGYDLDDHFESGYLPRYVDEYRRRPLRS